MSRAQVMAIEANALAAQGKDAAAAALYAQALAEFPGDARLANAAGNFHFRARRIEEALRLFEAALAADPGLVEAGRNAAIACLRLGRAARAAALLAPLERAASGDATYWTLRADAERQAGRFAQAGQSMARAEAIAPEHPKVARSRARLALERNAPNMVAAHEGALALNPGDPNLIHDYAQALAVQGRLAEALDLTAALIAKLPTWTAALALHAELRWAAGDRERFDDHFEAAAAPSVAPPEVFTAWSAALSGVDRHAAAAAVLARARRRWPDAPDLALAEAVALGEAGAVAEAQTLLDSYAALDAPSWDIARGRTALRAGNPERAEASLSRALAADPASIDAWALIDLCWRLRGDARHAWLHGQPGLVRQLPLPLSPERFGAVLSVLEGLHRNTAMPLGQSVKAGSQTKGALFAQENADLAALEAALGEAIASYRQGLPPADPDHPLLSRRDAPWAISGSWSIRLAGQGHHAAHIHPRGLLSSASYWLVPAEVDDAGRPGWLELGKPPPGLGDGLDALHAVRPEAGTVVLFPSTLFHGTRPIASGTRMTVAFDVTATDPA